MEVVGYAIHSGTQWRTVRTIKGGGTVEVGIEKKIFFHQAGRLVIFTLWW